MISMRLTDTSFFCPSPANGDSFGKGGISNYEGSNVVSLKEKETDRCHNSLQVIRPYR
jgi:hypothetical protein